MNASPSPSPFLACHGFAHMTAVRTIAILALLSSRPCLAENHAAKSASLVVEGWRHRVWSIYPVEKLKADEWLPTEPRADRVSLTIARGETEPFVLVLRSDVPLRKVNVSGSDLLGAAGVKLAASTITSQRMGYIHVDTPSGTRIKQPMPYETGTGDFPDPLLRDGGDARPDRNLQFLVTVNVPREARPGRYEGAVKLEFLREGWMKAGIATEHLIPLVVVVRSFAMPEVSPLINTSVASPQALTAWLQSPATLASLHREFVTHGQTPDPLPSPVVQISKDGTLAVDSAAWEKAAAEMLDAHHGSHLFLPVWSMRKTGEMQGVYFLWHYPAVTKQRWFGALICNPDGELTAEFQRTFGAYLKHMHELLKRRGWLDRMFITTMDEPYTYHTDDRAADTPANNYRVIRNYVRFVRDTAPGLRTFVTGDPTPELNGLIDHWCLRNLDHAHVARQRAKQQGELVTFCDNYRTFIDYPAVSARSLGWLAWKIGAHGWLTYETLGGFTNAWEGPVFVYPQFNGGTTWGLGQLFYPAPSGSGYVASSLRWELMREGCDDYHYLWLLRERLKAVPASREASAAVQEARALLATVADQVVGGSGDSETENGEPRPNAQSNRVPNEFRSRLGDLIEQLSIP